MPASVLRRLPERPVAFCLHSLGASAREFDRVAALLADEVEVLALDLPGFGEAAAMAGYSVDEMASAVIGEIGRRGAARWMLVGHSMGAKVASAVAARTLSGEAPVFGLAGVVLLAGSPVSPEPMDEQVRQSMLAWAADGPLSAEAARSFIDSNVGSALPADDDARAVADLRRAAPAAWTAWLESGSREDRAEATGLLELPALIVAGGADGELGEHAQRALDAPVYPRSTVEVFEGAGHLLPLERPAEVAETIRRFWRESAGLGPAVPAEVAQAIASNRTSARTRGILARRAVADDPDYRPQVLTAAQLATLRAFADAVLPQDAGSGTGTGTIDLAARLDSQLTAGAGDGWRASVLPPDGQAYRHALDTISGVGELTETERLDAITGLAAGEGWPGIQADAPLDPAQLEAWFDDAVADLVRIWAAHPASATRMGFDGYANGGPAPLQQGFELLGADEREDWEPVLLPLTVAARPVEGGLR